mmetsp:Transcript_12969/g.41399  ORF Transcript_12969/g.41399 Transcript_12969/m.41399 type:complete len:203 (-) Transcript_12969:924-1532(-)
MRQDLTCKFQSSASRYVPSAQVGPASPSAQPAASAAVSSARARVASSMCSAAPRCSCPSSIWKRPLCRFTSVPSARLPMPRKAIAPGRWARRYAKSSPPIVGCTSTYDSAPTSASAARCTVACPASALTVGGKVQGPGAPGGVTAAVRQSSSMEESVALTLQPPSAAAPRSTASTFSCRKRYPSLESERMVPPSSTRPGMML